MLLVCFRLGLCDTRDFEGVSYNLAEGWQESYAVPRSPKITETNQKYVQAQANFCGLCKNPAQLLAVHTLQERLLPLGPNILSTATAAAIHSDKNTNTKIQVLRDVTTCKPVKHCYD
jgi:hypothetical protein